MFSNPFYTLYKLLLCFKVSVQADLIFSLTFLDHTFEREACTGFPVQMVFGLFLVAPERSNLEC